ncbi:MAG: UDP-glycosyltransferase [Flavobacterium sp.]|uniref:UDP-glycosyltransferase n=1 Tax=Flavobacterium sp. TaxID=239 RepID=UPI0022C6D1C0|nr:UDP-glycosyltransferase [Flavobacterium sp.]MCZ8197288.1 UDP-glycosyltransferase [Flavobacterium sp.]
MKKKVLVLLPDGVGLRNFVYSKFHELGSEEFHIIYWNATNFNLDEIGCEEIKIKNKKINVFTDFFKNAKTHIELNLNTKNDSNKVYQKYKFPFPKNSLKSFLKSLFSKLLIFLFNSEKGLKIIRKIIKALETKTDYYKDCIATLKSSNPDFVFCTNQRPVIAIAPILAAQKLGIPTACFIYSWDNLPKATLLLETDYYFVWSKHMFNELKKYYPFIKENQIKITGTPQFEKHTDSNLIIEKEVFFRNYNLDVSKKYICFSGDDSTTSPNDQLYLRDIAKNIKNLNNLGNNIGVIFRKCPVDFSDRYDSVLNDYKDIIIPIEPKWKKISEMWDTVFPQKEDLELLVNTIYYTEYVVNVGSSMVFDYITYNKPCFYLNYELQDKIDKEHYITKLYDFIHFGSMPDKDSVIWLNSSDELEQKLLKGFEENLNVIKNAYEWFNVINTHPIEDSSKRIVSTIKDLIR